MLDKIMRKKEKRNDLLDRRSERQRVHKRLACVALEDVFFCLPVLSQISPMNITYFSEKKNQ